MSEKEKKIEVEEEEEKEKEMLDHWSHEHPLTLVDTIGRDICYGCGRSFSTGEQAYGCSVTGCKYSRLIHEECAATMREIRHPLHTQHILSQRHHPELMMCVICENIIYSIGYKCTSSRCGYQVHLRCAQGKGVMDAATNADADEQRHTIIHHHPSHPDHELKLLRRRFLFKCDACGTTRKDSSYICTKDACQYLIHQKCASLPQNLEREDHHHSLSLSFQVPPEYIIFNYKCDVCSEVLRLKYWIYHCQICRFIVHIKCAFNKPPPRIPDASIGKDIVRLPTNEVVEELITPFVMRQRGGETLIPPIIIPAAAAAELMKVKYEFLHHQHQLTLLSSGDPSQQQKEENEENYGVRSELICDGCITPISSSSSSSSSSYYYYYMSCSECKYNLHIACFHLPPNVPSLPIHHQKYPLVLQSLDKHQPWEIQYCSVCEYRMNGLFYTSGFKVDIKCACMPDTILHAAHPHHLLKHVAQDELRKDINWWSLTCAAGCGEDIIYYDCYRCCNSSCDFIVHLRCTLLPASVTSRRWDEYHPLLLMYDATLNRPGDFYCDQCEKPMNPKSWMYHCRACDLSFHPHCFQTISGAYRNMKLGQEYVINDAVHPHPLSFQLLTTKRRCDICRYNQYERQGFYCALCNFFICYNLCGAYMVLEGKLKAADLEKLSILDH
ncbi:uncharacterized protein LOC125204581 [Salvia hispanica]|uniref:uncharacterized protein LOC125204581 n=1 Tax=Salvia hispanica TaxID=49212 RepID=UPI002009C75C|nr:uncharacterized protein LOC125204581 [Salvia hispanica]